MSPAQVDWWASDLADALGKVRVRRGRLLDSVHHHVKDRREYRRGVQPAWRMTHEDALARAAELLDSGALFPWDATSLTEALADLESAGVEERGLAEAAALPHAEWMRRGWSRFYLVTSSAGGHIHDSTGCGSCRSTTTFVWLPDLAGRDEAAAVAEHGPLLCTRCFPSAPLEWTRGNEKPASCAGAGEPAKSGTVRRRGMRWWGKCSGCDESYRLTGADRIWGHKPKPRSA
ncbi:hypothetical protein ACWD3I_25020 [Streptomyces sp. NPDC002817]|uniref:hypothetical protein n=1 Tax=Streptomyces sp. NPDC088357 TaxID=3154655 RepID=UPI00341F6EE7